MITISNFIRKAQGDLTVKRGAVIQKIVKELTDSQRKLLLRIILNPKLGEDDQVIQLTSGNSEY